MTRKVEIDCMRRSDGQWVGAWRFAGETYRATYAGKCAVHADRETAYRFAVQLATIEDSDKHGGNYDLEASPSPQAATEPTPIGLQYVIPGCEKDQTRGPVQMSLF